MAFLIEKKKKQVSIPRGTLLWKKICMSSTWVQITDKENVPSSRSKNENGQASF